MMMEKSAGASVNGGVGGSRLGEEGKAVEDMSTIGGSGRRAESLLRVVPMVLCMAALVVMLKNSISNEYGAVSYKDLGGFSYLIYANGICAGYSLLSALFLASALPHSTTTTNMSRAWAIFFLDQVLTYVILAAATASTEVVFLAYKGDQSITWSSQCGVFGGFCRKASVSVGITFAAVACYFVLSLISSYRLFSNYDAPISSSYLAKGDHENGNVFNPRVAN